MPPKQMNRFQHFTSLAEVTTNDTGTTLFYKNKAKKNDWEQQHEVRSCHNSVARTTLMEIVVHRRLLQCQNFVLNVSITVLYV